MAKKEGILVTLAVGPKFQDNSVSSKSHPKKRLDDMRLMFIGIDWE